MFLSFNSCYLKIKRKCFVFYLLQNLFQTKLKSLFLIADEPSNGDSRENQNDIFVDLEDEISAKDNLEDLISSLGSDSFIKVISDIETTTKIPEIGKDTDSIADQVKESIYETFPIITLIGSNEPIIGQVITTEAELTPPTVKSEDRLKTDPEKDLNDDVLNVDHDLESLQNTFIKVGIISTSTSHLIIASTTDFDILSTVFNRQATVDTERTTNTEDLDNAMKDSLDDTFDVDSTGILVVEEIAATTKHIAMFRESKSDNFFEDLDSESIKDFNDKMTNTPTLSNHHSKTEQSLNEGSWIVNGFETKG